MNNLNRIDKKDTPIKVFSNTNLHVSLFLTKIENLLKEKIAKSIEIWTSHYYLNIIVVLRPRIELGFKV